MNVESDRKKQYNTFMKSIELLAPVGSYEALRSAIRAGADSIYFGVTHLNMRAGSAKSFDLKDLKKIVSICHKAHIRAYLTVNTIIYDREMDLMKKVVDAAHSSGVDAIIASDVAVLSYAHQIAQEVHCSTQLSISNFEAVRFFSQFADRMVLARELDLGQISDIVSRIKKEKVRGPRGDLIEIEVFGHGAMCISVSGRCFMSGFENNLSANRGLCRQVCRRPYRVTDTETGQELAVESQYVMSPEDLCSIDFLDRIAETGISCLKIEGRGRSPEYVFTVVSAYRRALDALTKKQYTPTLVADLLHELQTVYNRGLSKGFFFGRPIGAWSRTYGSRATTRKLHVGRVTHFFPKRSVAEILVQSETLRVGDQVYIIGPSTGTLKFSLSELRDEKGKKIKEAHKGAIVTFPVLERVRTSDNVYVIEPVSPKDLENQNNERLRDRIQK